MKLAFYRKCHLLNSLYDYKCFLSCFWTPQQDMLLLEFEIYLEVMGSR